MEWAIILAAYLIPVAIMFFGLIFMDRSDNHSVTLEIPVPYFSREAVFMMLAIFWPVVVITTAIDYFEDHR